MTRFHKVQYFESEGRENLPNVIKSIKTFLRDRENQDRSIPKKIVFLTREGEGPLLAYNQFHDEDTKIFAVTFPIGYRGTMNDQAYFPEIPGKLRQFFAGVGIPIITNRLPLDDIIGAESHNREMSLVKDALALFGGSVPLAVQAVLQAVDAGFVDSGEMVIAVTGDTALLIRASSTRMFLAKNDNGLVISEIICKPRDFNITRKHPALKAPDSSATQIEGESVSSSQEPSG